MHTPGPWKSSWNGRWLIQTGGGWLIAKVWPPKARGGFSPENVEANARLIAAAPELLEACRTALVELQNLALAMHPNSNGCIARAVEAIKPAIAKATK